MSSDEDRVRLIAALTIAVQLTKKQAGETFEQKLVAMGSALGGSNWSLTVARDLKLGLLEWIDHPWHCYKLKQLVPMLLKQELLDLDEKEASNLLARCCAMTEFGVDVNAQWYRRLREIVIDHKASARELRSLLRHSTVWWGTSMTVPSNSNFITRFFCSIWSMGRPSDGELILRQHHWLTKVAILTALCVSGFAFGTVSVELLLYVRDYGLMDGGVEQITLTLTYGAGFWTCWWIGPSSWAAVSRLQELLDGTNPTP